jgi:hypothetical protein
MLQAGIITNSTNSTHSVQFSLSTSQSTPHEYGMKSSPQGLAYMLWQGSKTDMRVCLQHTGG